MDKAFLEDQYNLRIAKIKKLREGIDNNVYLIETDTHQLYILRESKRGNFSQYGDDILFETTAIAFFNNNGLPVPQIVPTKNKSTFIKIGATFYVLFEYKIGTSPHIETYSQNSFKVVQEAGRYLAKIHNLVPPPHLPRRSRTVFTELERVIAHKKTVTEKIEGGAHYVKEVEHVLRRAHAYRGKTGFVHNDYRSGNILFKNEHLSAILDFDWLCIGPCAKDVGLAVVEWSFPDTGTSPNQNILREFYLHYNKYANHPIDRKALHFWILFACLSETATYLIDMLELGLYKKTRGSFMYKKYQYFKEHPVLLP